MINLDFSRDALFFDVDGTLLDIAPKPDGVFVPSALVEDLGCLYDKLGGALAFITGRSIENADGLFAPLCLPCAGVHGAEWRLSLQDPTHRLDPLPKQLRAALIEEFSGMMGVLVEDKTYAVSVHYRLAPELVERIESLVQGIVAPFRKDCSIIHSRKTVEVLRNGFDKGQALERYLSVEPYKGRRPIFLGDSRTDIPAMLACEKKGGIAVCVGRSYHSRPFFDKPETVREWVSENARSA